MIAAFQPSDQPLDYCVVQKLVETDRRLDGIRAFVSATGTVHLFGTAGSFYLRQLAVEIVRRFPGVNRVSDGIEVNAVA